MTQAVEQRAATTGTREPAVWTHGLAKNYGEVQAVRGIDFEVAAGEVFGFLGPNGAGKTTTIAMLCTLALPTAGLVLGFLTWTYLNAVHGNGKGIVPGVVPVAALFLAFGVGALVRARHEGLAFAATALAITLVTVTIFLNLYPRVLVSSTAKANSLTIWTTSSSHYTLTVMTVVALLFTPIVLLYQGWTYWVFRHRLGSASRSPLSLLTK